MKLVSDVLKGSESARDLDHYETLMDVQSACGTAVEILNDLLCFDKLESGILELHKHQVSTVSFVTDCVNMFAAQAREGGVNISCTAGRGGEGEQYVMGSTSTSTSDLDSGSPGSASGLMMPLLESDVVCMDKFKMDQVLRNLISNALKFTPRGGSVSVSAHFVPTVTDTDTDTETETDTDDYGNAAETTSALDERQRQSLEEGEGCRHWCPHTVDETSTSVPPGASPALWGLHRNLTAFSRFISKWIPRLGQHRRVRCHSDAGASNGIDDAESPLQSLSLRVGVGLRDEYKACAAHDCDSGHESAQPDFLTASEGGVQPFPNEGRMISGRLKLIVTDTGAGISKANQLRLFKQIVQFNPEVLQAGGGSGLGLYITSSIVRMHAGTIKAHSAGPGEGSTFTVEIDMQRWSPHPHPHPHPQPQPQPHLHLHSHSHPHPYSHSHSHSHSQPIGPLDMQNQLPRPLPAPGVKVSSPSIMCTSTPLERERERDRERERERERERKPQLMNFEMKEYNSPLNINGTASSREEVSVLDADAVAVHVDLMEERCSICKDGREIIDVESNCLGLAPMLLLLPSLLNTSKIDATSPAPLSEALYRKEGHQHQAHAHILSSSSSFDDEVVYDVLIVDDSGLNRKMLSRLLRTAGYTCEEADDGLSAVEKVKSRMSREGHMTQSYDVILMDFVMPNMDGPTATVAIRGMGYTKPILGLTGNALDSDVKYFIDCGVDAVLAKPFDFSLFKMLMRKHARNYEVDLYPT